jgi:hypothetical protein
MAARRQSSRNAGHDEHLRKLARRCSGIRAVQLAQKYSVSGFASPHLQTAPLGYGRE